MNTKIKFNNKNLLLCGLMFTLVIGCDRGLSEDAVFADFSTNGDVFLDSFSGDLNYFPFVGDGADPEAFSVDNEEVFQGTSSMRFDVPTFDNGFVGATFQVNTPRNLSGYDALTFYAKASQGATLNAIGFGVNPNNDSKFQVTVNNLGMSTSWQKYIIPIPNPAKLTREIGMMWLSEGPSFPGDEGGYTFWLDEVQFEKLGTIGQARPVILNGAELEQIAFIGVPLEITGLSQTLNTGTGDITVTAAPSYFNFETSDNSVAVVDELGRVSITNIGDATISASLGNVRATGSLTLNITGTFEFAPEPTRDPSSVVSIFSDSYTDIPVSRYNSFFAPFQTTLGGVVDLGTESIINYTDLNFVGIVFNDVTFEQEAVPTVDATSLTHLHFDINVQEALQAGDRILVELTNYGATEVTGSFTIPSGDLQNGEWVGIDIPLSDFTGLTEKSRIGLILFNSNEGDIPTISEIILDNIYFYSE